MTPTSGQGGHGVAGSAHLQVPALPTPAATNAQQAWPTFVVDRQTRAAVANGRIAMLTVPSLFGSTPAGSLAPPPMPPAQPPTFVTNPPTGFGAPADPSRPLRTAGPMPGPGGTATSNTATMPPTPSTYTSYPQVAAFAPPATQMRAGKAQQVRTAQANINPDARAAAAMRLGWTALICAALGCAILTSESASISPVVGAVIGMALWLFTCMPAISNGRRALAGGITPALRSRARWGQALGWIATLIWVVTVVAVASLRG